LENRNKNDSRVIASTLCDLRPLLARPLHPPANRAGY
jgi:hypothetical protein